MQPSYHVGLACLVVLAGISLCNPVLASSGGGLPWEAPLEQIQESITGPVAGFIALAAATILFSIAVLNQRATAEPLREAGLHAAKADAAVNFGAAGAVIGHELTHGFDDEGRQFDGGGNLNDWWTPEDKQRFQTKDAVLRIRGHAQSGKRGNGRPVLVSGLVRATFITMASRL